MAFFLFLGLIGFQIYLERYSLQNETRDVLAFDAVLQKQIDSAKKQKQQLHVFPFNPNYISLSKGYQLELTLEEIERLHRYRSAGKFVNSVEAFKQVTQVSLDWIAKYSPLFKFPDWVTAQVNRVKKPKIIAIRDINLATASDLTDVRGIGAVFSKRIVNYRTRLQGFDTLYQLHEVYGLDSLVVKEIGRFFEIQSKPKRLKIALATATLEELNKIHYLSKSESKKIIGMRTRNRNLTFKNLHSEPGFDSLKLERLALYLY